MRLLADDLIEIYNNLQEFSKSIVEVEKPSPIKVWFDKESIDSPLVFKLSSTTVRVRFPIYYCLALEDLEDEGAYLLPKDYQDLMWSLHKIIYDNRILGDRVCVSPENYGFDIYSINPENFQGGLEIIGRVRFITPRSTSWLYKTYIEQWKYRGRNLKKIKL